MILKLYLLSDWVHKHDPLHSAGSSNLLQPGGTMEPESGGLDISLISVLTEFCTVGPRIGGCISQGHPTSSSEIWSP
jgi:hypothetical protein